MALSIDWATKVINVPKADMQLVQASPTEIRQLDINAFRLELKSLEADVYGMPNFITHNHVAPITVGGVTLARVVEIINGYTVTFEDGQYAVNLVGANSNIGDVTNVNQVSIRSANSAGLTFSEQLNDQSFTSETPRVYINLDGNGLPGIQFPRGTPTDPVNNFDDANFIADTRKFQAFDISGLLVFTGTENLNNHYFYGHTPLTDQLVMAGNDSSKATFERLGITGTLGNVDRNSFLECSFVNLSGFYGLAFSCAFDSLTLQATPVGNKDISILNCLSAVAGTSTAILDCNNTTADIEIRNWTGGLEIRNLTQGNNISIETINSNIIIASSCTSANLSLKGRGTLVNNGTATINKAGYSEPQAVSGLQFIDLIKAKEV